MTLSDRQIDTYSRQIILREFGGRAQETLLASTAAILGDDLAAETAATYLAGAGVGRLLVEEALTRRDAFAPLAERSPDTELVMLDDRSPAGTPATAASAGAPGEQRGAQSPAAAAGEPGRAQIALIAGQRVADEIEAQIGTLFMGATPQGTTRLLLLPADAALCARCVAPLAPIHGPAEAAIAGTLAALTALRWLAGIGDPPRAEARELGPTDAAWSTPAWPESAPCPHRSPR